MIVWGAVRTAVTWLVGGYLVALATVIVPALALTNLLSPDAAAVHAALGALVAAGPVAGLVAAWGTTAGVVQGAVVAGAQAAPPELVAAVGRACRARHVRTPVCWTAAGLDPAGPPVVVRGLRSGHAFLPAGGGRTADDTGDAVARAVAGGGAGALLVTFAVCRWWRVWVDAARLCVSPIDTVRRRRASDGAAWGAALVMVPLLPFLLVAVVCAVPAWVAARIACCAVAPRRLQAAAEVFGTVGGRPRAVQEIADPEAFADQTPWALQRALGPTRPRVLDPLAEPAAGRWWRRPLELGAGFAAAPLALLALAMVFLAPAVGFVGESLTEHVTWAGEQQVTAVVTAVVDGTDDALLTDVSENSRVTLAVPGTRWAAGFDTSRSTFAVGDEVTVVVANGSDLDAGLPDVRWPDRRTVQRSVTLAVVPVLVAWAVLAGLGYAGGGRALRGAVRSVRATQEQELAGRDGTEPAAAAAVLARWQRREARAAQRGPFLGWAVLALVPTFFAGWLGSFPGRWIGGLAGDADGGRQVGFLVAAALAYLLAMLAGRAALRRKRTGARAARPTQGPA